MPRKPFEPDPGHAGEGTGRLSMQAAANSIFLARLIGPVIVAIAVGVLANSALYRRAAEESLRNYLLIYLSGVLMLTAGLAVVLTHNVWAASWRVLITLIGWVIIVGGALRILVPDRLEPLARRMLRHPQALTVAGVVMLAIGAVLCFFGYR
jgi:hypothetical protein